LIDRQWCSSADGEIWALVGSNEGGNDRKVRQSIETSSRTTNAVSVSDPIALQRKERKTCQPEVSVVRSPRLAAPTRR
jgi:hypothetical protein